MEQCLVCNRQFKNKIALSKHINMSHDINGEQYTLQYIYKGINPTCRCGCGGFVTYINKEYRFCNYLHNHHNYDGKSTLGMKVHTKDSINRAKETRRKTCLEKYGVDSIMKVKEFSDKIKRSGPFHSQWKGGTSKLTNRVRGSHQLYIKWIYPILIRDGFKCVVCGNNGNLNVHHDKERMCEILHRFIPEDRHELNFEEEGAIIDLIIQYHVDNQVSGVTLCEECHKERH